MISMHAADQGNYLILVLGQQDTTQGVKDRYFHSICQTILGFANIIVTVTAKNK